MVRVRKNANTLSQPSERSRFLFAWRKFRNQLGATTSGSRKCTGWRPRAGDEGHRQPAFLPWHRAMLLHVERELQKIDPTVALHYWNWDCCGAEHLRPGLHGRARQSVGEFGIAEPVFAATNPLNGWNTDLPFSGGELRRSGSNHTLAPDAGTFQAARSPGRSLARRPAGLRAAEHLRRRSATRSRSSRTILPTAGPAVEATSRCPVRSAADPLFYLLHSQIDRQWAYWQRKHNRHGVVVGGVLTFPAPAHYDNNGNFDEPA